MRNTFRYHNFDKISLLNALLNLSDKHETLSILVSNLNNKDNILPTDYVTYDIIAGIGSVKKLISNKDSLDNLKDFHNENKDWLFGYISYDLKNELEELDSNNYEGFISDNLTFFIPEFVILFGTIILFPTLPFKFPIPQYLSLKTLPPYKLTSEFCKLFLTKPAVKPSR